MIVTRKVIPRRTVLRGIGATVALPLLDGMVPAFASAKPILRFGAVYVPNGMAMKHFFPATEGTGFEITPILEPLRPFRDRLVVLGGLSPARGLRLAWRGRRRSLTCPHLVPDEPPCQEG